MIWRVVNFIYKHILQRGYLHVCWPHSAKKNTILEILHISLYVYICELCFLQTNYKMVIRISVFFYRKLEILLWINYDRLGNDMPVAVLVNIVILKCRLIRILKNYSDKLWMKIHCILYILYKYLTV